MKLKCYAVGENTPVLRAAPLNRQWMDDFPDRHAYRCLPLAIANVNGWQILCPTPVEIEWNGGPRQSDLTITALKPLWGGLPIGRFCKSNFSRGIVTFHTEYLFMTDPGWDLLATGSFNEPKDNATPLTGIIESDWLPYPFTMNWQITRPGRVRFDEDEPFCMVMPVQKQALVGFDVEIHRLSDNSDLKSQMDQFQTARGEFLKKFEQGDPVTLKQAWQRFYFTGQHPDGTRVDGHVNKMRLSEPVDCRGPMQYQEVEPLRAREAEDVGSD